MNSLKKKKILVIDDDEELCEEVSGILEGEGYTVSIAAEEEMALRLADAFFTNSFNIELLLAKIKDLIP